MQETVTIVMYHYVRDLARSRYPEIKGCDLHDFREQLGYICRYYTLITAQDLIHAVLDKRATGRWELPANAALLTFDDGVCGSLHHVFPLLAALRVQGSFFAAARAICEQRVLDVNKIHFILAAVADKRTLVAELFALLDRYRAEYRLEENEAYYRRIARASRYDPPEVVFIKRLLQRELPVTARERITAALFAKYVSQDEAAFASELYMDLDQLRCLAQNGMYIGSHAYNHVWLSQLTREEQAEEIDRSIEFLSLLGNNTTTWIMCYPYGDSSESLRRLIHARGGVLGLTTRVAIAHAADDPLLLPRLDTTDLPTHQAAPPGAWTTRVLAGRHDLESNGHTE